MCLAFFITKHSTTFQCVCYIVSHHCYKQYSTTQTLHKYTLATTRIPTLQKFFLLCCRKLAAIHQFQDYFSLHVLNLVSCTALPVSIRNWMSPKRTGCSDDYGRSYANITTHCLIVWSCDAHRKLNALQRARANVKDTFQRHTRRQRMPQCHTQSIG